MVQLQVHYLQLPQPRTSSVWDILTLSWWQNTILEPKTSRKGLLVPKSIDSYHHSPSQILPTKCRTVSCQISTRERLIRSSKLQWWVCISVSWSAILIWSWDRFGQIGTKSTHMQYQCTSTSQNKHLWVHDESKNGRKCRCWRGWTWPSFQQAKILSRREAQTCLPCHTLFCNRITIWPASFPSSFLGP